MKKALILLAAVFFAAFAFAQRWQPDSHGGITWIPDGKAHSDHLEMSGKQVSVVLRYGVNATGNFNVNKSMIWPLLRTIPNNTHASLMRRLSWDVLDGVTANNFALDLAHEKVAFVSFDGMLRVQSKVSGLDLQRTFLPSVDNPGLVETYLFKNSGTRSITVVFPDEKFTLDLPANRGVDGSYHIEMTVSNAGVHILSPGDSVMCAAFITAYKPGAPQVAWNVNDELRKRRNLLDEWKSNLVLSTPDPVLDRMFAFSKIRACESIYETKGGPMHGPGGESYYAAIWANDQAEYINPYFPFTGYAYGNASAVNSFRHFARFMNDSWKPIPSSVIAEGDDIWNGAGDRGDAAMIAYGAARYALASGQRAEAVQLWPLIEWCLEYCRKKLNAQGVVMSDTDELEGRFPTGNANLCTSSLYYDALLSAAYLADDLHKPSQVARNYRKQAATLRKAIDNYFHARVEGFDTYAYYEGNDVLRSWICIPLTVGITERAQGTIEALLSPRLFTENGLLTQAGSKTFWDRSTLYALRGMFRAGATQKAMDFLHEYSQTRLLGDHVPYAIEAWPEGSQRHLSAESGLYGRIITEGLFGIRPTGLRSFEMSPRLPESWNEMSLRHIRICNDDFDLRVYREKSRIYVELSRNGKVTARKETKELKTIDFKL